MANPDDIGPAKYLNIGQCVSRYCVGRTTLHHLIEAKKFKTRKLGSKVLIDREDADRFFESLPSAGKPRRSFKTYSTGR